MKIILITLGIIFVGLGMLGIVVPGLPTTPFLLLASACFVKSSTKLHNWLMKHKIFGKILLDFIDKKGLSKEIKMISIFSMIVMISVSVLFLIQVVWIKIVVISAGVAGIGYILSLKTISKKD